MMQTISVTKGDLCGEFIGQTVPKTKHVIKSAEGGVMFVDEAYTLVDSVRRIADRVILFVFHRNMDRKR